MRCAKCQSDVPDEEIYVKSGMNLCEDCYIIAMSIPRTCDVGAVSAARASRSLLGQKGAEGLTPLQHKFYDYVKKKGSVLYEDICEYMGIAYEEANTIFAVLRHLELVKGHREGIGDDTKYYVDIWS